MATLTLQQQFKLKELNNKLYTGISGTDRSNLIENFDSFLQQYSKHVEFMEELNFFKNSIKQRFYTKQMELTVGSKPRNQANAIQGWLESGRTLTQLQAIEFFGCLRLAAVIHTLRHDRGLNIEDVGEHKYSEYKLL